MKENEMAVPMLDPDSPRVFYDIRNDAELLTQIAEASLSKGKLGLSVENGVVGSLDWWSAVNAERVPIVTFTGKIVRVDSGPMGDSAIIRIEGDTGMKSWVAWEGFHPSLVGTVVEVLYARVKPKHPPREGFVVEVIIQVRAPVSGN